MIMVNHVDDRDDHNREGVDDQETNGIRDYICSMLTFRCFLIDIVFHVSICQIN